MRRPLRTILFLIILVGLAGGGYWLYRHYNSSPKVTFRTAAVKRGDLVSTISATGTVEPEEVVDVGAQVAGLIDSFGKDANGNTVDYRSPVKKGTVLAHIDDVLYASDRDNAQAALDSARIGVLKAQADLNQAQANANKAQRDWDRAQKIGPSDALSQSDFDTYQSTAETTKAAVEVAKAASAQAKQAVVQAEAALSKASRNVAYCTIASPVDGIIIDRRVNTGQTVVSSLNAPSLFLIAKDLSRMQVWVAVNEADIGSIVPDQPVTFTVDARPGRTFHGKVGKVRLNAQMTQNVVTYTVEIQTDNEDGALLPYLTANVRFEVSHRHDVLLASNAALRYEPTTELIAPDARAALTSTGGRGNRGAASADADEHEPAGPPGATTTPAGEQSPATGSPAIGSPATGSPPIGPTTRPRGRGHSRAATRGGGPHDSAPQGEAAVPMTRGRVWVREGEFLRPIRVRVGPTDGAVSEIQSDEIKEGTEVVVGEQRGDAGRAEGTTNPFAPQFPRRGGGGQGGARGPGGAGGGGGGGAGGGGSGGRGGGGGGGPR